MLTHRPGSYLTLSNLHVGVSATDPVDGLASHLVVGTRTNGFDVSRPRIPYPTDVWWCERYRVVLSTFDVLALLRAAIDFPVRLCATVDFPA